VQYIGGLFAVLNPVWKGYFKGLPVVDIRLPLVPWKISDLSALYADFFKKEENVRSKKVCFEREMHICNFIICEFHDYKISTCFGFYIMNRFLSITNQIFYAIQSRFIQSG
jgi:hypothetical protein